MKRLSVTVFSYEPHVRCAGPGQPAAPPLYACDTIIDQMPTDPTKRVFGPVGFPNVDIRIPVGYHDRTSLKGLLEKAQGD